MRRAHQEPVAAKLNEGAKQSIQQVLARRKKQMLQVKHTATVTKLARAMRYFFVQGFKKQLANGEIKSKYFHQFEMCDVISPKCFVVLPIENVALMPDGKARKMVFKVLNSENIQEGFGTPNPSEAQIRTMIDDWIYMAPKSKNIVQAYEIFKDDLFYMQLTEYCEAQDNLYDAVKLMNLESNADEVTMNFCKFVYKYTIQISHAFMNAHRSTLTHGEFNLTQVICDQSHDVFKLINFRPWLVSKFKSQSGSSMFSRSELLKIAKANDLYQFGVSIFELMCGKTQIDHISSQKFSLGRLETENSDSQFQRANLPQISTIPFAWMKLPEAQCLIEVLHMCMLIDTNRDTVHLFSHIHQLVSRQYTKYFDAKFKPNNDYLNISVLHKDLDIAIGMNNRQVISRFKLQSHGLNKVVSETQNREIVAYQMDLLKRVCEFRYVPDEAFLNLCLHQWKQGLIFDEEFCAEISNQIYDKATAWWICLVFRRAMGLAVTNEEEAKLVKTGTPSTVLGGLLAKQYGDLDSLGQSLGVKMSRNFEMPLSQLFSSGVDQTVRKIFFSTNEKYCIILTSDTALVIEVSLEHFQVIGDIKLPKENFWWMQANESDEVTISASGDMMPAIDKLVQHTQDKAKEAQQAKELQQQRARCNGYFSSPWVAAVDDWGTRVMLHRVDSVKLVPRTEQDDQYDYQAQSSDKILSADSALRKNYPGMRMASEIYLFSGRNFTSSKKIDIGRVCPDEVLDISFKNRSEPDFIMRLQGMLNQKKQTDQTMRNDSQNTTPKINANLGLIRHHSAELYNLPLNVSFTDFQKQHLNRSANQAEIESDWNTITVKCKDLMEYTVNIGSQISLIADPQSMPGGAAIPVAIFNLPQGSKREKAQIKKQQKTQSRLTQLVQESRLEDTNYKTGHYEHIKEFIEKHEQVGNMIRFAKDNNKKAVGFQHCDYDGKQPHFFVYDIQRRTVDRRFLPHDSNLSIKINGREKASKIKYAEPLLSGVTDSKIQYSMKTPKNQNPMEQVQKASNLYFEVSPQGTYLLCVDNGVLSFKLLTPSYELSEMLQPAYFAQEHQSHAQIMGNEIDLLTPVGSPTAQKYGFSENPFDVEKAQTEMQEYEKLDPTKTLAEQLVLALNDFTRYVGTTYIKHMKLMKLHNLVARSLEYPESLVNPGASLLIMNKHKEIIFEEKQKIKQKKKNPQDDRRMLNKMMKRCFYAIRLFHQHFSKIPLDLNPSSAILNIFCHKSSVRSIKQFTTFDQIAFRSNNEKIKRFQMCSLPSNMMIAVYFSRALQIYDIATGNQIFELCVPSARKFFLIDQEQCIIVQEGNSTVIVASIQAQRKSFNAKNPVMKAVPKIRVEQYENEQFDEYKLGLAHHRELRQQNAESDAEETVVEDEAKASQTINWDEDILNLVTARNIAAVGYFALIGSTKTTILLTYADEDACQVDHVWTLEYTDFIGKGYGLSIKQLDFSNNCENFIAYTNSGYIAQWDIKNMKFERKIYMVRIQDRPIAQIRSVNNSRTIVTYSRQQNLFMVIDADKMQFGQAPENYVTRITPSEEGFKRAINFQVDISQQFLIVAFEQCTVGVFNMKTGALVMRHENPSFFCEGSFIDETGCYMATLDDKRRFTNIHTIEWIYKPENPQKAKQKNKEEELNEIIKKQIQEEARLKLAKRGVFGSATSKVCAIF